LLEFINVLLLHSPLNLLWILWILYALAFERRKWLPDPQAVFLLILLGGFGGLLWLFHASLGVMRDWDIYAPLGLLLAFSAWRLWEVSVPKSLRPRIAGLIAVLLPLAACHLALWSFTLHSSDRLIVRMFEYAKEKHYLSQRGKEDLASNVSRYCVENNYFPDFLIDHIGADDDIRKFVIYRLSKKDVNFNFVMRLAERWSDKLEPIDCANIGGLLINRKKYDESLYYLRLSTNRMQHEDKIVIPAAYNLALYYSVKELMAPEAFYMLCLPDEYLEKINPAFYQTVKKLEIEGSLEDSVAWAIEFAPREVYSNGLALLKAGYLKSAEQELIAARYLGVDSLKINPILDKIRRLKERP